MSERTTWTTEDEIEFIDDLPTKRVSLAEYILVLRDRKDWTGMDRKRIWWHLKERMG
ncbi:MAG: hypothetical protein WC455_28275 [Dehalococcoidia bacterium]|jgi:hypothetical protein